MMRRENGRVFIEISGDEWSTLLLVLGTACGYAQDRLDGRLARDYLRLANSINEGNPKWTPYQVKEEPKC